MSGILSAAGNRYNMKAVLEAIRIQYPAGMTITSIPKSLASLSSASRMTRSSSSRATSFRSTSSMAISRRGPRAKHANRWTHWQTEWEPEVPEWGEEEAEEAAEEEQGEDPGQDYIKRKDETDYYDDEELILDETVPPEEVPSLTTLGSLQLRPHR